MTAVPTRRGSDAAALAAIAAHSADTTDVHGIADTSVLVTRDELAAAIGAGGGSASSLDGGSASSVPASVFDGGSA